MESLEGRNTKEIYRQLDKVAATMNEAAEVCAPKLRATTIPHPEIDPELKGENDEATRIKTLLRMGIDYGDEQKETNTKEGRDATEMEAEEATKCRNIVDKIGEERFLEAGQ